MAQLQDCGQNKRTRMIYIFVLVCLLLLLYRYDIKESEEHKNFWYSFVLLTLIVISGLRYRIGGDTVNYLYAYYHDVPYIWDISYSAWESQRYEPLFFLFLSVGKSLGLRFFVFQLMHATFVNGLIFAYIKKHSNYPFTCVFFYFIWMYAIYNFEELRASMSIAICLFANDYIIDKKIQKGIFIYLIGSLFHYSTIALVITPLFLFLKMNLIGGIFLIFAFVMGYVIQSRFGDYLMLFELNDQMAEKAANYANSDFYFEQRITLRGSLFLIVPYLLYSTISSFFLRSSRESNDEKDISLMKLEPLVILGLTFVLFSVPMPICYRFVRFYIIYFVLYFSFLFCRWIKNSSRISAPIALLRSLILFVPMFNLISHIYKDPIRESSKTSPYYPYEKYYPYSSVIEKSVDNRREKLYNHLVSIEVSIKPNTDEY